MAASSKNSDAEIHNASHCWFGFEEHIHVKAVLRIYSRFMTLDTKESRCMPSRAPEEFIGVVDRRVVSVCDVLAPTSSAPSFRTVDVVFVYQRDDGVLGSSMTFLRKSRLLTRWDCQDGLPIEMKRLGVEEYAQWKACAAAFVDRWHEHTVAYMYCEPVFGDSEYSYHATSQRWEKYHGGDASRLSTSLHTGLSTPITAPTVAFTRGRHNSTRAHPSSSQSQMVTVVPQSPPTPTIGFSEPASQCISQSLSLLYSMFSMPVMSEEDDNDVLEEMELGTEHEDVFNEKDEFPGEPDWEPLSSQTVINDDDFDFIEESEIVWEQSSSPFDWNDSCFEMSHSPLENGKSTLENGRSSHENGRSSHEIGTSSHEIGTLSHEIGRSSHENNKSPHENYRSSNEMGISSHENGRLSHEIGRSSHEIDSSPYEIGSTARENSRLRPNISSSPHENGRSSHENSSSTHKINRSPQNIGSLSLENDRSPPKIKRTSHESGRSSHRFSMSSVDNRVFQSPRIISRSPTVSKSWTISKSPRDAFKLSARSSISPRSVSSSPHGIFRSPFGSIHSSFSSEHSVPSGHRTLMPRGHKTSIYVSPVGMLVDSCDSGSDTLAESDREPSSCVDEDDEYGSVFFFESHEMGDVKSSQVDSHSSQVDNHSSQVDSNSSQVDGNSSEVDSHSSQVDSHSSQFDGNSSQVDSHSSQVDSHSSQVDNHSSQVDSNSSQVDGNSSQVDSHSSQVDSHSSQVDSHSSQVDSQFSSPGTRSITPGHGAYQMATSCRRNIVSGSNIFHQDLYNR
eukprot:924106_1